MPRVFSTQCNQPSMSYPTPTNIARGRVRIITTATWARNLPHRGPPSRTSWLTSTSLQAFKARTRLTAQLVVRTRISIMDIHGMHPPLRSAIPFNPQNVPTAGSFSVFAAQPTSESIVLHPDAHVRPTKILDWAIMRSRSSCCRTETAGSGPAPVLVIGDVAGLQGGKYRVAGRIWTRFAVWFRVVRTGMATGWRVALDGPSNLSRFGTRCVIRTFLFVTRHLLYALFTHRSRSCLDCKATSRFLDCLNCRAHRLVRETVGVLLNLCNSSVHFHHYRSFSCADGAYLYKSTDLPLSGSACSTANDLLKASRPSSRLHPP